PNVYQRAQALLEPPDHTHLATYAAVDGLNGVSGVLVSETDRTTLVAAARYAEQLSQPGEPIFVYPSSPLIYVLADRPNPTRFAHLNPAAATPDQLTQVIADLQRSGTRLGVLSDFWEMVWGPPGANAVLEGWYIAHYTEVARYGAYRVLLASSL